MQQRISLKPTQPASSGSAVKSVALATFRFLRAGTAQASKLPGVLQHVRFDIVDAWQESASPKP